MAAQFKKSRLLTLGLGVSLLAGCTSLQGGPSVEEQRLNRRLIDLEARLESQGQQQGSMDDQQSLRTYDQIRQMETELRTLRGDVERLNFEVEGMKRRQRELYLDIDRRLQERASSAVSANISSSSASSPVIGTATDGGDREAYKAAFALMRNGNYDQATAGFQDFLGHYPDSPLADNAQYWLAEGYYVTRQFDRAKAEFTTLITNYPDSSKLGDGLLKLGYVHYELKQWPEARSRLNQVLQQYPGSTAASYAQQRLDKMTSEGH